MKLFRDLDKEETKEFQQWARDNYCHKEERSTGWHPVVRSEMLLIDKEKRFDYLKLKNNESNRFYSRKGL